MDRVLNRSVFGSELLGIRLVPNGMIAQASVQSKGMNIFCFDAGLGPTIATTNEFLFAFFDQASADSASLEQRKNAKCPDDSNRVFLFLFQINPDLPSDMVI